MEVRSLGELVEPDERALPFTRSGLSLDGTPTPQAAAAWQQEAIAHADLVDAVPDATRQEFERIRRLHAAGVLEYELFTTCDQRASIALDLALGERFMAHYAAGVPLVRLDGTHELIKVGSLDELRRSLRYRQKKANGGWKLDVEGKGMPGLRGLFGWARAVGLLHGQRNRLFERALIESRNHAAHPDGYELVSPVDSARRISDLAEIVNRLWGSNTPGGRLYPGPVQREIIALGWNDTADRFISFRAGPETGGLDPSLRYVLVRAVWSDSALLQFDSLCERTEYPADYLFGPGSWDEAGAWLASNQPKPDQAGYMDRSFLVRVRAGRVEQPRRPSVALAESDRAGEWYLTRADHPTTAFVHVRGLVGNAGSACDISGPCSACAVRTVAAGPWSTVSPYLLHSKDPTMPPAVRVPGPEPW